MEAALGGFHGGDEANGLDLELDDVYADVVMERTTVYLDEELKRRLKTAAARAGTSEAHMIRQALLRDLGTEEAPALRPVGRSRDGGVAERDEQSLADLGFGRG